MPVSVFAVVVVAMCGLPPAAVAGPVPVPSPSPTVGGRTLEQWRARVTAESMAVRLDAMLAIGQLGEQGAACVPLLMEAAEDPVPEVRWVAAVAMMRLGSVAWRAEGLLAGLQRDPHPGVRIGARFAFQRVAVRHEGRPVSEWESEFRKADRTEKLALVARFAAATDRGSAAQLLEFGLSDRDADVRRSAAEALGEGGPPVDRVWPALLKSLGDESPAVRTMAAAALARSQQIASTAVAALSSSLKRETEPGVRLRCIASLGKLARSPDVAVPVLSDCLKRPEERIAALKALAAFGPAAGRAVSDIGNVVGDEDAGVRAEALGVLARIGPAANPVLVRSLRSGSSAVRADVVAAMGRTPTLDDAGIARLGAALSDPDAGVRTAAMESLKRIGHRAGPAAGALVGMLSDDDGPMRSDAEELLARIGDPAVAALERALTGKDFRRRAAATRLLLAAGIGQGSTEAAAALLTADSAEMRRAGLIVIAGAGRAGISHERAVRGCLSDRDASVRIAAAWCLCRMEVADDEVIRIAGTAFGDPEPAIRRWALEATSGTIDEAVAGRLAAALTDTSATVRDTAVAIIRRSGGPLIAARLLDLMRTGTTAQRSAAVEPLAAVLDEAGVRQSVAGLLRHADVEVRIAAALVFARVGGLAGDALSDIEMLTRSPDRRMAAAAESALQTVAVTGILAAIPDCATLSLLSFRKSARPWLVAELAEEQLRRIGHPWLEAVRQVQIHLGLADLPCDAAVVFMGDTKENGDVALVLHAEELGPVARRFGVQELLAPRRRPVSVPVMQGNHYRHADLVRGCLVLAGKQQTLRSFAGATPLANRLRRDTARSLGDFDNTAIARLSGPTGLQQALRRHVSDFLKSTVQVLMPDAAVRMATAFEGAEFAVLGLRAEGRALDVTLQVDVDNHAATALSSFRGTGRPSFAGLPKRKPELVLAGNGDDGAAVMLLSMLVRLAGPAAGVDAATVEKSAEELRLLVKGGRMMIWREGDRWSAAGILEADDPGVLARLLTPFAKADEVQELMRRLGVQGRTEVVGRSLIWSVGADGPAHGEMVGVVRNGRGGLADEPWVVTARQRLPADRSVEVLFDLSTFFRLRRGEFGEFVQKRLMTAASLAVRGNVLRFDMRLPEGGLDALTDDVLTRGSN